MRKSLQQIQTGKISIEQILRPQMMQSLKMLAMSTVELEMTLKQEINENPLLELDEEYDDQINNLEKQKETVEDSSEKTPEKENEDIVDDELKQTLQDAKELSEVLDSWNEYHSEFASTTSYEHRSDDDEPHFERYIQADENLKIEFINQFDKFNLSLPEYYFVYDLIDSSNEYGFLPKSIDKENGIEEEFDIFALSDEYKIKPERAVELHTMVMRAFPRGVSARNIGECLYHQLETYEQKDELLVGIILDDFDALLHRKYQQIAKKYDVSEDDVLKCRERISHLDPKPGLRISSGKPQYIVPDIIVTKIENEYEIIINDFNLPYISLSRHYNNILTEMSHDKSAISYVKNKINSAKFIIKSVFLRNRTLERVMRSIIDHQRNFFFHNKPLEPLNYTVIAHELNVNESTISRVVKSKYVDTHFGVFCLKDFFCINVGKEKGFEAISKQNVFLQVKQLIEREDCTAPISDQNIVDILKERGIRVSRRVITKYREELNIPNSRERKKVR